MDAYDVTLQMIRDSGKTNATLSRELSDNRYYINSIIKNHTTPRADKLAQLADSCGYDLLVRRRNDERETMIDPYD
jgi:hypothetical protein